MICKKCGAVISDYAKFCNVCGESQEVAVEMPVVVAEPVVEAPVIPEPVVEQPVYEAPVVEQPVYQQPVYQQPVVEQPVYEAPVSEPVYAEEAPKGGKGLAITSLVLGIVGLVFGLGGICCCGTLSGLFSILTAIVGIILAFVAKNKGFNDGLFKVGMILNIICLVISVALVIVFVVSVIRYINSGEFQRIYEEIIKEIEREIQSEYGHDIENYYNYYAVKSVVSTLLK
ncbi:MAG: zinc-ribbon domain-containing protein [Clostridia bacterium]|nr:zinc-ribbon domain-containing protein [Clostridia bacterium]